MTRHNIGYRVIDRLAKDMSSDVSKGQCRAVIGQATFKGHKIILAKPQTFMNLSGESVLELIKWFKVEAAHWIVICDDLDLEVGKLRIRAKGNSGGHKGLESIIGKLGTTEFVRIKIGIGRPALPSGGMSIVGDTSNYVLSKVPADHREPIDNAIITASEAATTIIADGLDAAMNKYNSL